MSTHISPPATPGDHGIGPAAHPAHAAAVLVVDDEPGMRNFLGKALASRCALVETADCVETAEALRRRYHFDLFVVDIRLPGESGAQWVQRLREQDVRTDVIVMTAYANLDTAVAALRAGAADFLLKPFRIEQLTAAVDRCLAQRTLARENFLLRRRTPAAAVSGIVGHSAPVRELCELIRRVAPTHATVLLQGETGTGKELVAQAIHDLSGRDGAFVPVNCGSIPPDLLESELFGHTRGAFTSAHAAREGLFSFARGGTIFLDEISAMPAAMQAKLLRVLEERRVRAVGADREVAVDTRVIAASNRALAQEVRAGRFREDLFFRLDVLSITVPALRDRVEDIAELAHHFCTTLSAVLGVPPLPLGHDDIRALQRYPWPGNVRELRNVIERSLLLSRLPGESLLGVAAGAAAPVEVSGMPLDWSLAEVEKDHILRVLAAARGNKSEAARRLGVSRKTLERKLKAWAVR
jgi:two-component system NtrC family response regulator